MHRLGLSYRQLRRLAAVLGIAMLVVTANAALASQEMGAPTGDFTIVAEFTDAGAILKGSEIKVDGVKVGEVSRLTLADGVGQVVLSLDESVAPIYEDASVTIRPVSLLGERYVDLERGTPTAEPLPDGGVIPAAQNRRTVDLDEVLSTVDEPTGVALAALITTLGEGSQGNGEEMAAALESLTPALTDTGALVGLLDDQTEVLSSLIDRLAPITSALGSDRGARLDSLVQSASTLLATTAAGDQRLLATLQQLPATLTSARVALSELGGVAANAAPALQSVRPLTGDLRGIAQELAALSDAADPALAALDPVLDRGLALIEQARPLVAELGAAGGDLESVAASARPLVEHLDDNLANILDFIRNWSLVTNGSDGVSHYFRAHAIANPDMVTGMLPVELPPLPLFDLPPDPASDAPPDLLGGLGAAGEVLDQVLGNVLGGLVPSAGVASDGSATGLTETQEQSLLGYLLGGLG
jgi:phospholipid/cholesterol/gamma-HCH transport system substrate-binding protein